MLIHLAQSYWIKPGGGTDCSCPRPAAPCFSSSLPWGGQETGISDPPLPELSRWGEGKKVGLPFRSPFPCFLLLNLQPVLFIPCSDHGGHVVGSLPVTCDLTVFTEHGPLLLIPWSDRSGHVVGHLPWHVTWQFLQRPVPECSVLSN